MHRFYVSNIQEIDDPKIFLGSIKHQLKNVLRFRKDDLIEIFDETSFEYSVRILDDDCDFGKIISKRIRKIEMYPEVILCQSFIKNDRFELIIEKSSELGVTQIIPMITERVQSSKKLKKTHPKHQRWRRIIKESVEQSGGNVIPHIESFHTFEELLELFDDQYEKILFWEKNENSIDLKTCLNSYKGNIKKLVIFIGPVGGFSESEILMARENRCKIVTLGDRVLKSETVSVSSLSIIRYHFQGLVSGKYRD
ncbi:MAG: hypothetical protein CL764_02380 [Chloroflexi bacterium]|nr:hypothetical protein [Chloroflexota bacterium]|tara:strand:+ start:3529 stop:4287 length:759 start_codon:yes stop_codon:yes gene_type:complete